VTWFASLVTELLLRNRASVNLAEFFRAPCRKNYAMDRKMNYTVLDALEELYHHAKFGKDPTTPAGCVWENIVSGKMQRSGKLPVLNLLTGQNHVIRRAWATRCTDSCQSWQDRRARGCTWLCKISPQSPEGVGMRPQTVLNFHFLVKSRPAGGTPLTDF